MNETEIEHSDDQEMTTVPSSSSTKRVAQKKIRVSDEKICQDGQKANKDGVCEPVEPASEDDSQATEWCPVNYVRVDSSCLYIKPKSINATRTNETMMDSSKLLKPRLGNMETNVVENIPVQSDNSCPEGTEYSEHGVCQKRVSLVDMKLSSKYCPENTQLVQGQCLPLTTKMPMKVVSSSTMETPMETSEQPEFDSTSEMFIEATTIAEQAMESRMETTSQSVTEQ